jgi:Uma2 family endonuclease
MPIILAHENIQLPSGFANLGAFRHWATNTHPDHGRYAFLNGDFYVDLSMEQVFTHNGVKGALADTLSPLIRSQKWGYFHHDGALLSNPGVDLSTKPDGMFVSFAALDAGLVQYTEGARRGIVEVVGRPDVVIEVVSDSSVKKDTELLRELYALAKIPEYWLIDARTEPVRFELLRWVGGFYRAVRRKDGWYRSPVFQRAFALQTETDSRGHPQFTLVVRV